MYEVTEDKIVLEVKDFCIKQILECGQCFRYYKLSEKDYIVISFGKIIRAKQINNILELYCDENDYNNIWKHYFDMDRDYGDIKDVLAKKDPYLKLAVNNKYGVRLLRQDPFETLISFVISQNKHITHIKKLIEELSKKHGTFIGEYQGQSYYSFPKVEDIKSITEDELRALKVGFRAPYIVDAINKVMNESVDLESIYNMSYEEAKKMLMSIKGVGNKVADCVLLFAYGKYEVFPTDVWVKRVMEYYYFKEEVPIHKITEFAKTYFNEYAGFAQQYLFYYARDNKIGK